MADTHLVKDKEYNEEEKVLYTITYCGERYPNIPAEDGRGMALPDVCPKCADAKAKES